MPIFERTLKLLLHILTWLSLLNAKLVKTFYEKWKDNQLRSFCLQYFLSGSVYPYLYVQNLGTFQYGALYG